MKKQTQKDPKEQLLLRFIKVTKEGKLAIIEESSLPYARVVEERDTTELGEEEYYYSIT